MITFRYRFSLSIPSFTNWHTESTILYWSSSMNPVSSATLINSENSILPSRLSSRVKRASPDLTFPVSFIYTGLYITLKLLLFMPLTMAFSTSTFLIRKPRSFPLKMIFSSSSTSESANRRMSSTSCSSSGHLAQRTLTLTCAELSLD